MHLREKLLKSNEIVPLSFDYVFTGIFNNQDNIGIVENFISIYLGIDIEKIKGNVEILSRNIKLNNKTEKSSEVDLLLKLDGNLINIEMNRKGFSGNILNGVKERNIQITKNMLKNNIDIDVISSVTGLSIEDINKFK